MSSSNFPAGNDSQQQQQQQQQSGTGLARPRSLCSGLLPENSSVTGLSSMPPSGALPALRPQRLWTVNDTSLRPIPRHYPKLDPKCTVYISDASPSVIAVRIAECLRKRSISVEYDDEAVTATAMTVDRCHFVITMYRGSSKRLPFGVGVVDFSHGVIVECMRISGSVLSFHRACRAVLQSAMGQSAGDDDRKSYTTSVLEFRRLKKARLQRQRDQPKDAMDEGEQETNRLNLSGRSSNHGAQDLEQALELMQKDRFECQQLGLERLVALTDAETCGQDIAVFTSLQLLQDEGCLWNYLKEVQPQEPGEKATKAATATQNTAGTTNRCASLLRFDQEQESKNAKDDDSVENAAPESATAANWSEQDSRHKGIMRASALRVFCNALSVLSDANLLIKVVNKPKSPLVDRSLLDSLVQDLMGANRPPSVVLAAAGGHSQLSSAHEAALAVRCLRLLGEESESCYEYLQTEQVMERLEIARTCGRSTHLVLQQEAEWTYTKLTEDLRSC